MWQRLLLRELVPLLPRLLRLVPMLESLFAGDRSRSPNPAGAGSHLFTESYDQIARELAHHRLEILEVQSKLKANHQELQMLGEQMGALEERVNELAHKTRLILVCCALIGAGAFASLVMIAVLLSRSSH